MSTVARRVLCSPVRLSSSTWQVITGLICEGNAAAAAEFGNISGIASSLISDQAFKSHPLVVKNKGPRLRVYCLYGDDAISGEDANEEKLSWRPTAEEWHAFLPCGSDECAEFSKLLKRKSVKFTIYDVEKGIPDDEESGETKSANVAASVDWEGFKNL